MTIAEDALRRNDELTAREFINRVVHDIDQCRGVLRLIVAHQGHLGRHAELLPTLMFNRARLLSQLRTLERDFDAAIDAAEDGADELRQVLEDFGVIEEADSENVGVVYLRELGRHLRAQHAVALTLRERLQVAIDNEDYEAAASLHDELRQRNRRRRPARGLLPPA
jgi:hypothetical protein